MMYTPLGVSRRGRQGPMGSYGPSDDIAPRIRGGNKVGDDGIKGLLRKKTGSIKGWFNGSSGTHSSNVNYFNGSLVYTPSVVTITMSVTENHEYKIIIEDGFNGQSSLDLITATVTDKKIDCDGDGIDSVLAPLLKEQQIIKNHSLPRELQFELDQLLIELKNYYQANGVTHGVVDVYREKKPVNSYGVIGKMVDFEDGYALLVRKVNDSSMADNAGLQVGDMILEFNDDAFNKKTPKILLDGLAKLSDGQAYNLLVQRADKKQKISSVFVSKVLPAFHLSVDMSSVVKAQQALSNIIDG